MKDCHVHTNISHDGVSSIKEYLEVAKEKNVDEIIFTEHYDIYDGIKTKLKTLDVDSYKEKYLKETKDSKIKTNFGIEIGLQPDDKTYKKIHNMVINHDFDFIIGSSHITCKKDMAMDSSFFDGLTQKEAYTKYFEEVLENIQKYYYEFDVYGHIDYVIRYGGYDNKKINYEDYQDILDQILRTLIRKDKGIEVNTSGMRYGLGYTHPNIDIVKRYKELGGKIITVGSDAHKVNDLASYFEGAYSMLQLLGYEEICIYHNRQPEFVKIKELYKI